MYKSFFKVIFDFIIALTAIILLSPILILVGILVKVTSKGPVFFKQMRMGKNKRIFAIYKFRTMTDKKREVDREILKGDSEVTKVGSVLRRLKIDELPQLINIIKGDMAIVGPRPAMSNQVDKFNEDGHFRLKVRPGLTGLAQINGNIHLTWEERWKYDRNYVENISLLLDLKIILKTILIVFIGEDKFIKKPNV